MTLHWQIETLIENMPRTFKFYSQKVAVLGLAFGLVATTPPVNADDEADAKSGSSKISEFISPRPGVSAIPVLSLGAENSKPKEILNLQYGEFLRVHMTPQEVSERVKHEASNRPFWIKMRQNAQNDIKIFAKPGELLWIDNQRVRIFLTPAPNAKLVENPTSAEWNACVANEEKCSRRYLVHNELQLIDTTIVPGQPYRIFYKVHFRDNQYRDNEGDGWAPAELFKQQAGQGFRAGLNKADENADDDSQIKDDHFGVDLNAQMASYSVPGFSSAFGPDLMLNLHASLVHRYSTNLFLQYEQPIFSSTGGSFHMIGLGQEVLYAYNSHWKFGVGGNLMILNGASEENFATLAGGRLAFVYEKDKFFAAYRGGLVANTHLGVSPSNFEALLNAGWRPKPHGWAVIGSFSMIQAGGASFTVLGVGGSKTY